MNIISFIYNGCQLIIHEAQVTSSKLIDIIDYEYEKFKQHSQNKRVKKDLKGKMNHTNTYTEWQEYALTYDNLKEIEIWRETPSQLYDCEYVRALTENLRKYRKNNELNRVLHILRSHCDRNVANVLNPELYRKCYIGTKTIIEEFQKEFIVCLDYIAQAPETMLSQTKKIEFFAEMRHAHGRTALLLSGGGGLGVYHFGVVKTLLEEGMLPRIIAGSSAGSLFAAKVASSDPEELKKVLYTSYIVNVSAFQKRPANSTFFRRLTRFLTQGYFLDIKVLEEFLRDNLGDLTFQEAYDKTGYILNVTVTGFHPNDNHRLMNYLTAPNVLIWSACLASCALPYVYGPTSIYCKNEEGKITPYIEGGRKFMDGSLSTDLPTQRLSELFNVNNFIVSQTNPWAIPFMDHSEMIRYSRKTLLFKIWELLKGLLALEITHRLNQLTLLGILPVGLVKYLNLVTQRYTGNVTIWPIPSLSEYIKILDGPTAEGFLKGMIVGSRRTFPKINHIQAMLSIEKAIEINYASVKQSTTQLIDELEDYDPKFESNSSFNLDLPGEDQAPSRIRSEKHPSIHHLNRISSFLIPRTGSVELFKKLREKTPQEKLADEINMNENSMSFN